MKQAKTYSYRIACEMVDREQLYKFMNADPRFYSNCQQTVPNSQIPDEVWRPWTSKEGSRNELMDQFNTLADWSAQDRDFVRKVRWQRTQILVPQWVDA